MSWQWDFDSTGPTWEENAAAIAAEKRLEERMKEQEEKEKKKRPAKKNVDQAIYDKLDQEMRQLQKEEKEFLFLKNEALTEKEKQKIKLCISSIRKHFWKLKDEYVQLKKQEWLNRVIE